jgi:PIN domain nuclease of toxin-antitoxin system
VRLLLDTHVFLWWCEDGRRLEKAARLAIQEADDVFVSAASAWEVALKIAIGKLRIPGPFAAAVAANSFAELPITFAHATAVGSLPPHHTDPFDRMLAAQAKVESLTLVTHDRRLEPYALPILWT